MAGKTALAFNAQTPTQLGEQPTPAVLGDISQFVRPKWQQLREIRLTLVGVATTTSFGALNIEARQWGWHWILILTTQKTDTGSE
jgi:hypothetical protein